MNSQRQQRYSFNVTGFKRSFSEISLRFRSRNHFESISAVLVQMKVLVGAEAPAGLKSLYSPIQLSLCGSLSQENSSILLIYLTVLQELTKTLTE